MTDDIGRFFKKLYEDDIEYMVRDGLITEGRVEISYDNNGNVYIDKYIKPVAAVEYVQLNVSITKLGASFEPTTTG